MGVTQRQAAGKFTREEADAFIGRLQDVEADPAKLVETPAWRHAAQEQHRGRMRPLANSSKRLISPRLRRRRSTDGPCWRMPNDGFLTPTE